MLKFGFRYHDNETLNNIFWTCCILHNMLMKFDGLDVWEEGESIFLLSFYKFNIFSFYN